MSAVPRNHENNVDLGVVTRQLNSGVWVPEAAEDTTVPIDVVDRPQLPKPISDPPRLPPLPQPTRQDPPAASTPPAANGTHASRADDEGTEHDRLEDRPEDRKGKKGSASDEPPASPQRTVRDAVVGWIDARAAARRESAGERQTANEEPVTGGAFAAICLMTLIVAGLAFALSFDMMYAAASHYGWGARLAALFPLIIDVGAIGGTFMGAISTNRMYRAIGHQVLIVTLAASVLFNLVGHDIRGGPALGLPAEWNWTGTVAAVLIPLLLAYFVHAFSTALKTFADQRREQKLAEQREQQARDVAERAGRHSAAAGTVRERPLPQSASPSAPTRPAEPKAKPKAAQGKAPATKVLTAEKAYEESQRRGHPGPTAMRKHLIDDGYDKVPAISTLRSWINERKTPEERAQDNGSH
ncbi:DUF2637 domain-containing protein [Amycolatopsis sp. NPDC004079]|uniref:DUF2637 domain-containing protein n=1 Tax=Amycolatopsis sp. NPDC004079 TaxID=3154549 RepID=UPI0033A9D78F